MFARVTSSELTPEDEETFVSMIRDQVIPRARSLEGFTGGYWLLDRTTGRVLGVTLFESEEGFHVRIALSTLIVLPLFRHLGEIAAEEHKPVVECG